MDFHSMIGKLRAIESLGVTKNYVAEEEATTEGSGCTMTAEGESCPVHGLNECPMVPMEEADANELNSLLKNSGQMAEQDAMGFGNEWNDGMSSIPVTDTPSASDSGETWANWFKRIYGGGQTVATGGKIQGADTSGGVSGNPAGDFTGDPNSTPTSVKPVVEPTVPRAVTAPPKPVTPGKIAGGDTRMGAASTGNVPAQPQSYDSMPFGKAFAAARTAAGGAGGTFMWKGKPYQTNVKGEKALPWNSPQLKKVGGGWPAAESIDRIMELSGIKSDTPDDLKKVDDMAAEVADDVVDEHFFFPDDRSREEKNRDANKPKDVLSHRNSGDVAKYGDDYKYMRKGKSADARRMKSIYQAGGPKHPLPEDDMSSDMTIDDLMRKYGVSDEVSEDAPLVGAPFTPLGATNNGPEEFGVVVTGGTDANYFEEGITINSNMDVRDGKVTKSLSINATDDDVDSLAAMLRNAGIGNRINIVKHEELGNDHSDCGCGAPEGECQCGMALENADHDYGSTENSSEGEPLDTEEYIWNGAHLNQRFGKIGDNTLMAERAISIFKNYSKEYSQILSEADLEPSNSGAASPLTANNRDEFDKDPFVDETPVDDGSHSPLSTVKRQDVMN